VFQRRLRVSHGLLGLALVATTAAVPSSRAAAESSLAHGRVGAIHVRAGYAVRSTAGTAVAFFSISNDGNRPDVLLNALVGGLPVIGLWHRDVQMTTDQLADLADCGGAPAVLNAELLHWTALTVPAHRSVAVTPGLGQLEFQLPTNAETTAVTFDFDRAGALTMSIPVRSGLAPVALRRPA